MTPEEILYLESHIWFWENYCMKLVYTENGVFDICLN